MFKPIITALSTSVFYPQPLCITTLSYTQKNLHSQKHLRQVKQIRLAEPTFQEMFNNDGSYIHNNNITQITECSFT